MKLSNFLGFPGWIVPYIVFGFTLKVMKLCQLMFYLNGYKKMLICYSQLWWISCHFLNGDVEVLSQRAMGFCLRYSSYFSFSIIFLQTAAKTVICFCYGAPQCCVAVALTKLVLLNFLSSTKKHDCQVLVFIMMELMMLTMIFVMIKLMILILIMQL